MQRFRSSNLFLLLCLMVVLDTFINTYEGFYTEKENPLKMNCVKLQSVSSNGRYTTIECGMHYQKWKCDSL